MKPYQDRKEYFKNYYEKTKEEKRNKKREYAKNYYKKNAEKIKAKRILKYAQGKKPKENIKSLNNIIVEYSILHKDEIKLLKQQWRKEKEKLYQCLYFQKNKSKIYTQRQKNHIKVEEI